MFTGNIKVPEIFPCLPNVADVQTLWDNFKKYMNFYGQAITWINKKLKILQKVKSWVTLFTSLYQTKNVTPYMHALVAHVPKFLRDVGSLAKFSQQALGKLNDNITKHHFKSTNHKNEETLRQIMFKLNRLEELTDQQHYRIKHTHMCSTCKTIGNNKNTCPVVNM